MNVLFLAFYEHKSQLEKKLSKNFKTDPEFAEKFKQVVLNN